MKFAVYEGRDLVVVLKPAGARGAAVLLQCMVDAVLLAELYQFVSFCRGAVPAVLAR
jgi:hypothetical protein